MVVPAGHQPGRIGKRGRNAGELRHHRAEQGQLRAVLLVAGLVGAGQVAHHHLRRIAEGLDTVAHQRRLVEAEA
ncbi:hypothetical protein D3C87_2166350 [compost metagenome]